MIKRWRRSAGRYGHNRLEKAWTRTHTTLVDSPSPQPAILQKRTLSGKDSDFDRGRPGLCQFRAQGTSIPNWPLDTAAELHDTDLTDQVSESCSNERSSPQRCRHAWASPVQRTSPFRWPRHQVICDTRMHMRPQWDASTGRLPSSRRGDDGNPSRGAGVARARALGVLCWLAASRVCVRCVGSGFGGHSEWRWRTTPMFRKCLCFDSVRWRYLVVIFLRQIIDQISLVWCTMDRAFLARHDTRTSIATVIGAHDGVRLETKGGMVIQWADSSLDYSLELGIKKKCGR